MEELVKVNFRELVHKVFDSVFESEKFIVVEDTENYLVARRDDFELIFRLEIGFRAYLFSLEMKLLGKRGENVARDPRYRSIGVSAIAKIASPDNFMLPKPARSVEELVDSMNLQKGYLLEYCKDILNGDLLLWKKFAGSA